MADLMDKMSGLVLKQHAKIKEQAEDLITIKSVIMKEDLLPNLEKNESRNI